MPTQIKSQDIAGGSVGLSKLGALSTKGDILTYGTGHSRLPAGSDKQVLVSDSATSNGLRWANCGVISSNTSVPTDNTISSTSETAFGSYCDIPANTLVAGNVLTIHAAGTISTNLITASTLSLRVSLGSSTLGSLSSVPLLLNLSNRGWNLSMKCVVFSAGASGSCDAQGFAMVPLSGLASGDMAAKCFANTSPITVDTTAVKRIQIYVAWSQLLSGNSITLRQFVVSL